MTSNAGDFDPNDWDRNDWLTGFASSTFDPTFDYTFQLGQVFVTPTTQPGCRKDGKFLWWLTWQGSWVGWLFEGAYKMGIDPTAIGSTRQGGLNNVTQIEAGETYTLYTKGLTRPEADILATLRKSVSVYLLDHRDDNTIKAYRVEIPISETETWNDSRYTNDFSVSIKLPAQRSQLY